MENQNQNVCWKCKGTGIVFYTKKVSNYCIDEDQTELEFAKKCPFCNGKKTLNNNDNEEVKQ